MPDLTTLDFFLSPLTWENGEKSPSTRSRQRRASNQRMGPFPSLTRRLAGTPCWLDNSFVRHDKVRGARLHHHHIISNEPTSLHPQTIPISSESSRRRHHPSLQILTREKHRPERNGTRLQAGPGSDGMMCQGCACVVPCVACK